MKKRIIKIKKPALSVRTNNETPPISLSLSRHVFGHLLHEEEASCTLSAVLWFSISYMIRCSARLREESPITQLQILVSTVNKLARDVMKSIERMMKRGQSTVTQGHSTIPSSLSRTSNVISVQINFTMYQN